MDIYEVTLAVDRAAKDTQRRIRIRVFGSDRLSAAICAETMADKTLREPGVEYTHAVGVRRLSGNRPRTPAAALAA